MSGKETIFFTELFRFVNAVANSELGNKVIWEHIKNIRLDYLMKSTDLKCENSFIPQQNILSNFDKISQILATKSFREVNQNLTKSTIDISAEMFLTLNSCPSSYLKLYWKAIHGSKSRIAMLASNIIKIANGGLKKDALKIFAKITEVLGFQHITYHHEGNDIKFTKNIVDITG